MKLDSKYFDAIRVKGKTSAKAKPRAPACAWEGCEEDGIYKAPLGRDFEGPPVAPGGDHGGSPTGRRPGG